MWEYVILVWVALGAVYWIIKPLLGNNGYSNAFSLNSDNLLEQLNVKKEGTYATIRELEFDLKMGKLSEEDFQILKQQYLQEAADYMKAIDELKALRAENPTVSAPDFAQETELEATADPMQQTTSKMEAYCAGCGQQASIEDNFCGGCGQRLKKGRTNLSPGPEDLGEETQ